MAKKSFKPFKNEQDSIGIGELTIENRIDRVSVYGTLDITKDKQGLAAALQLKSILDDTVAELQKADLPDQITVEAPETVSNPFV